MLARSPAKLLCLALSSTLASSTAFARGPSDAAARLSDGAQGALAKDEPVTPESASSARFGVEQQGQGLAGAGAHDQAAQLYWSKGVELKDPVLIIAAAEAWRDHARATRAVEPAQMALTQIAVAFDMLYFLRDGATSSSWQPVGREHLGTLLGRAGALVVDANALITEIEAERAAAANAAAEPEQEPRRAKPGTGLIAGGSAALVLGVGGAALGVSGLALGAQAQADVEDPTVYEPEHSAAESRGRTANVLAGVGLAVAGVGVGVGVALLMLGLKKRRQASAGLEAQLVPLFGPDHAGLGVAGRF